MTRISIDQGTVDDKLVVLKLITKLLMTQMVPLGPLEPRLYQNYPKAIRLDQSARII